jgi:hypothetical protein
LSAAVVCAVIAVVAAVSLDSRLDRHWVVRGVVLVVALCCAALLLTDQSRLLRQIITGIGLLMFGLIIPVTSTVWATPPEIDFALKVATDAKNTATKSSRTTVTIDDVKAAVAARHGAVGSLKTDRTSDIRGADAYPLIIRETPNQGRPRACISFTGLNAKVRAC